MINTKIIFVIFKKLCSMLLFLILKYDFYFNFQGETGRDKSSYLWTHVPVINQCDILNITCLIDKRHFLFNGLAAGTQTVYIDSTGKMLCIKCDIVPTGGQQIATDKF